MGLSAVTLRARQYIAITLQLSLTAVKESLLEQGDVPQSAESSSMLGDASSLCAAHPYDSLYL